MAKVKKKSKKGLIIGIVAAVVVVGLIVVPRLTDKTSIYTELTAKKDSINTYYTFSGNVESKNTQNVMAERIMRVSALLRRAKIASDNKLIVGSSIFDYNNFTVMVKNENFDLPKKEFQLIFKLLSQPMNISIKTL